ncbi:Hypothetical predicted protein [Octopus vulgaris]|uniref:Uncharacterized protein n=1 Tax=Octopus vulgaris TaxID=6645 RepID=A0AA36BL60_OCTVU|nr:Hypothetical predicted protein [Octopus vulgaris]
MICSSSRANPDLGKNFDYNMEILETGPLDASKEFYGNKEPENPESKIEEEHCRVIKEIEENHRNQFENCKQEMESQIESLKERNSSLQSAFNSYQATLLEEMEKEWSYKQQELYKKLEAEYQEQINALRERLENEKESEIDNLMKEHREQEEQLKKEHGEKLESMAQYYYNVMEELKEMNSLKHKLKRGQLKAFEDNFDKKVDEVDDHYKLKINNLLMMNSELRKTFRKKCEELATEKYCASQRQEVNIKKIKDTIESCRQKKTEIPNIPGFQIPSQSADKEVAVETTTDSAKDYHQLLDKDFFKCTDIVKSLN